jgi:DNA mismatch repair ATPase MutS
MAAFLIAMKVNMIYSYKWKHMPMKIASERGYYMEENMRLANKESSMKILMWAFIILAGFSAYLSLVLGQQRGSIFYSGFILIIPFGILILYFRNQMLKYRALYHIKNNWGKTISRKRKFKDIKKLHEFLKEEMKEEFFIDNQTWEDFTMDKIYEMLDRTLSTPGEQVLYNLLRNPKFDEEFLNKRKKLINLFQDNKQLREKIQTEIYGLNRQNINTITDFLWGQLPSKSTISILFNVMALLPVIIIILMPFYGLRLIIYLVFVFMANMYIHYKFRKEISVHIDSMTYLSAVVNTAKKLVNVNEQYLEEYIEIFKNNTKHIKASKNAGLLSAAEGIDFIVDYANIMFLNKERKFYAVLDELTKHREELKKIYLTIGELDAIISISSYRAGLASYVEPELVSGERFITANAVTHPLIAEPVANSISINNSGIVLTGSNMSGKSTFLRTIGVNALFAQTICTCLAESYRGSYFKILSSISPTDDLLVGKSYYLGEAEAVLRIIKSCEESLPSLCIIDEIFRGTNPIERVSASAEILNYLISHNSLPIVATHDLELTEIVDKDYECYYFTEDVDEEGLKFDYLIRKGVSPTRNAIKLLKYLGYPEEIIEKTYQKVENLAKNE